MCLYAPRVWCGLSFAILSGKALLLTCLLQILLQREWCFHVSDLAKQIRQGKPTAEFFPTKLSPASLNYSLGVFLHVSSKTISMSGSMVCWAGDL